MEDLIYVPYIRVSSKKQEVYGHSLDAQLSIIKNFVGTKGVIFKPFIEVETGTRKRVRPVLKEALEICNVIQKGNKDKKVILITTKLDRLARDVSKLLSIIDSGVEVQFCDMPNANRMMITIFGAIAEYEAQLISDRTKVGLAEARKKGRVGGMSAHKTERKMPTEQMNKSMKERRVRAKNNPDNKKAYRLVKELKEKGLSWTAIAKDLNDSEYPTSTGGTFSGKTAKDLFMLYK